MLRVSHVVFVLEHAEPSDLLVGSCHSDSSFSISDRLHFDFAFHESFEGLGLHPREACL